MTRELKSLQSEVLKSLQKRSEYKKKEEILHPQWRSELKLAVVPGLPGSPSAAVHPGNQHPGSPGSTTAHTSSCLVHGRKLRTKWGKKRAYRK